MIYKGKVLKVEKEYVIVITEDCRYLKLHPKSCSEGKSIIFVEDDILNEENNFVKSRLAAAIIAILILTASIVSGVSVWDNYSYAAVVELDMSPRVEFMIDKNDMVKKVKAKNEEGKDIISDEMEGIKIEEAVSMAIDMAIDKGYLTGLNENIVISRANKNKIDARMGEIKENIEKMLSENDDIEAKDIIYVKSSIENYKKAKKLGMTMGEYEIKNNGKAINTENKNEENNGQDNENKNEENNGQDNENKGGQSDSKTNDNGKLKVNNQSSSQDKGQNTNHGKSDEAPSGKTNTQGTNGGKEANQGEHEKSVVKNK